MEKFWNLSKSQEQEEAEEEEEEEQQLTNFKDRETYSRSKSSLILDFWVSFIL